MSPTGENIDRLLKFFGFLTSLKYVVSRSAINVLSGWIIPR
jgi:hypothetical protein